MENMVSVEKIKVKDILATIRDFFSTSDSVENNKALNEKLQKVYEIEKEIGATKSINSAEKFVQLFASKVSKKKDIASVRSEDSKTATINKQHSNQILDMEEEIDDLEK